MINVFGHLNPDSDAICSAVATAWWLNQRGQRAKAWRLGEMNRETQFLFQQAGVSAPELLQGSLKDKPVWLVDFTEPAQGPEPGSRRYRPSPPRRPLYPRACGYLY